MMNHTLIVSFVVLAMLLVTSKPAEARKKCGGENQKSCWHVNPDKWCSKGLQYKGTGKPGKGICVKRHCGGKNQNSCWNINPDRWCNKGLQYEGTGAPGDGRCIKPSECGGVNQRSCWSANPENWCDGNLKYVPGIGPGKGRCVKRITNRQRMAAARALLNIVESTDNPLLDLSDCLAQPDTHRYFTRLMKERRPNIGNQILQHCNISATKLKAYGTNVLSSHSQASNVQSQASAGSTRGSDLVPKLLTIEMGLSAGAVVGVEGALGYAHRLDAFDGRYYVSGGPSLGFTLQAGADVAVGLSSESLPTSKWATDSGYTANLALKVMVGGGIGVDFPDYTAVPVGFSISGGIGAGIEAGVVKTWDLYLYKNL